MSSLLAAGGSYISNSFRSQASDPSLYQPGTVSHIESAAPYYAMSDGALMGQSGRQPYLGHPTSASASQLATPSLDEVAGLVPQSQPQSVRRQQQSTRPYPYTPGTRETESHVGRVVYPQGSSSPYANRFQVTNLYNQDPDVGDSSTRGVSIAQKHVEVLPLWLYSIGIFTLVTATMGAALFTAQDLAASMFEEETQAILKYVGLSVMTISLVVLFVFFGLTGKRHSILRRTPQQKKMSMP